MKRIIVIAAAWAMFAGATVVSVQGQTVAQTGTRFTLSGVVVIEGASGRAWLQEPSLTRNEVVSVRTGESIGAYRLTKVFEDRVELEGPTGKFSVPLAGAAAAPAAPVVASPAPAPSPTPVASAPEPARETYIPPGRPAKYDVPGSVVRDFASIIESIAAGAK